MRPALRWMIVTSWLASFAASAGTGSPVFGDGFESPCNGTVGDLPGCIVVPFEQAPLTPFLRVSAVAAWNRVDVYLLLDRSGSMQSELESIRTNFGTTLSMLRCPPEGSGTPGACFPDLWSGAGTIGYAQSTGGDAYRHALDLQPNPDFSTVSITEPDGCCSEVTHFALASAISGLGTAAFGCGISSVLSRSSCAGSPAGVDGFGYGCFRPDAAALVLLASDEAPSANTNCPNWATGVRPFYLARRARVASVYGDGAQGAAIGEFLAFANDTGTVDATNGNQALVFSGGGSAAVQSFELALQRFRAGTPIDVDVVLVDNEGDGVDTRDFVDRIELVNDGSDGCPNAVPVEDFDTDGTPDTFDALTPGTLACFRIVPVVNSSVPPTSGLQIFGATLHVLGEHRMPIATRRIWFAVPGS
jgi:hypothetical protein